MNDAVIFPHRVGLQLDQLVVDKRSVIQTKLPLMMRTDGVPVAYIALVYRGALMRTLVFKSIDFFLMTEKNDGDIVEPHAIAKPLFNLSA